MWQFIFTYVHGKHKVFFYIFEFPQFSESNIGYIQSLLWKIGVLPWRQLLAILLGFWGLPFIRPSQFHVLRLQRRHPLWLKSHWVWALRYLCLTWWAVTFGFRFHMLISSWQWPTRLLRNCWELAALETWPFCNWRHLNRICQIRLLVRWGKCLGSFATGLPLWWLGWCDLKCQPGWLPTGCLRGLCSYLSRQVRWFNTNACRTSCMLFVRSDQESCSCKSPNLFKFLLGLCMSQQGEQSRIHLGTWEIRKIPEDVGLMQRCRKILMGRAAPLAPQMLGGHAHERNKKTRDIGVGCTCAWKIV